MTHELKTYPKYFQETIEGNKPFEIRKNDRNFQVGDVLILKEWDNIKYSGREIGAVVRYVLRDFIGRLCGTWVTDFKLKRKAAISPWQLLKCS
jgi:hypothetical protein